MRIHTSMYVQHQRSQNTPTNTSNTNTATYMTSIAMKIIMKHLTTQEHMLQTCQTHMLHCPRRAAKRNGSEHSNSSMRHGVDYDKGKTPCRSLNMAMSHATSTSTIICWNEKKCDEHKEALLQKLEQLKLQSRTASEQ